MSDVKIPLVTFKKFFKELDDRDILTFEAYDKESQELLRKKLLPTYNPLMLEKAFRNGIEVLLKPESLSINHKYDTLEINVKSGVVNIPLDDELLDFLTEVEDKNFYYSVKLTNKDVKGKKAVYFGELIRIYTADYDFETAKLLLDNYKPVELLMYAIGYENTVEAIATRLPLLLPLFQYADKAIHTVLFTMPRFGKSRTARVLMGLTNAYLTTLPTPSKLIYDGAKNKYGLTYFYNTLYIDEFDKIQSSKRKEVFKDSYELLLTGMSDGIWMREVSSMANDFINIVGFCFMGNFRDKQIDAYNLNKYTANAREKLYQLLDDIVDPNPFVERITYIEFNYNETQAYKLLNYNENNMVQYLHAKVSRALIKLLQDDVRSKPVYKRPEDELEHHMNAVKAVMEALQIELDDDSVERLVKGDTTFLTVLNTEKELKEKTITEEDIVKTVKSDLESVIMNDEGVNEHEMQ